MECVLFVGNSPLSHAEVPGGFSILFVGNWNFASALCPGGNWVCGRMEHLRSGGRLGHRLSGEDIQVQICSSETQWWKDMRYLPGPWAVSDNNQCADSRTSWGCRPCSPGASSPRTTPTTSRSCPAAGTRTISRTRRLTSRWTVSSLSSSNHHQPDKGLSMVPWLV